MSSPQKKKKPSPTKGHRASKGAHAKRSKKKGDHAPPLSEKNSNALCVTPTLFVPRCTDHVEHAEHAEDEDESFHADGSDVLALGDAAAPSASFADAAAPCMQAA